MVFILGIDIPIIAFFSIVAITITVILLIVLVTMLVKGGKLIKEAEEVIDEEEQIHHLHLHSKKVSKPAAKIKVPSIFRRWNAFWAKQKTIMNKSWESQHAKETWWEKHKKAVAKKEEKPVIVEAPTIKTPKLIHTKGPTIFQRWDSYWNERKTELFNQPKWTEHKAEISKIKPVIVKTPKPVKKVEIIHKEKQPKRSIKLITGWNNYWNKQKKDLDEGMKPEKDEKEEE